jgi:hypothetical protein
MTVGTFKGRITPLNLPEVLKFLRESGKTGMLRVENDGVWKALFVRRGRVVAADSSVPGETLLAMLLGAGRITEAQESACETLVAGGLRPGRALVELGVLGPAELWEWTERRVRGVVRSVMAWESGSFAFEEGMLPAHDWMLADLDILDAILTSLREIQQDLPASRLPEPDAVLDIYTYSEGGEAPPLLPYERYVLGLVNGRRTAAEIARLSELGDAPTRRILGLLMLVGCVRNRRSEAVEAAASLPEDDAALDARGVIRAYNEMFAYLYTYMIQEVGPIAEHVLDRYLREVREANPNLFNRIALGKDGTLSEEALARNLHLVRGRGRRDTLVSGLNEYLYAGLLAVKRTLGADHEAVCVRRLKEIRKIPASLG